MIIDRYGGVALDQQNANNGVLDHSTTYGAGLIFGQSSGEGIASKRTPGGNQFGLDFYTQLTNRMTITSAGSVGINTTNPAAQLHVIKGPGTGATDGIDGGPVIIADTATGDAIYANTSDGAGYAINANSTTGVGVYGLSISGIGVYGDTSSDVAVYASGGSGSALTIADGAIHVTGAGRGTSTAAFIQAANANNIAGAVTFINNPLCNGDPNAILIVTPNFSVGGGYWNHPCGVFYETMTTNAGKWAIVNEDAATMTAGPAFNVLIIKN